MSNFVLERIQITADGKEMLVKICVPCDVPEEVIVAVIRLPYWPDQTLSEVLALAAERAEYLQAPRSQSGHESGAAGLPG